MVIVRIATKSAVRIAKKMLFFQPSCIFEIISKNDKSFKI